MKNDDNDKLKKSLHVYCEEGDISKVEEILKSDPELINCPNFSGNPPLSIAIKYSNIRVVKTLLQNYSSDLDIDFRNNVFINNHIVGTITVANRMLYE